MAGLSKSLGLPMLIFYGTGMILGAGIYSIIGKAAEKSGETLWLGFILAGISALLTALSYAELATMYPKAGAEFVYLREAFKKKKWIGSTIGIAMAFSGAATAATVAIAFAGYLNEFFSSPTALVAAVVLLVFTGIAIVGIKTSGWVTVISTLIEVGGLIFIIYLGFASEKFGEALGAAPSMATLSGAALIIFSFFGFENIVNLSEEAKKPERDVPLAVILSVIISSVLYVGVSLAAVALLPLAELAGSSAPLMDAAKSASEKSGRLLGAIALFSTANTALISLVGASRILYSMGKEKALPSVAAKVLPKRKTPWIASLLVLGAALLLLPLGKLETVAGISSLTTMIAFLSVNVCLIVLRKINAKQKRPFKVPISIGNIPVITVVAALLTIVLLTQFEAKIYAIGGAILTLTAIGFYLKERKS